MPFNRKVGLENLMVRLPFIDHPMRHLALPQSEKWLEEVNILNGFSSLKKSRQPQLKTSKKECFRKCFRKWQEWGNSLPFEAREDILRGINGIMSFTVKHFRQMKHSPYFLIISSISFYLMGTEQEMSERLFVGVHWSQWSLFTNWGPAWVPCPGP